jgi:hypothetical protein
VRTESPVHLVASVSVVEVFVGERESGIVCPLAWVTATVSKLIKIMIGSTTATLEINLFIVLLR